MRTGLHAIGSGVQILGIAAAVTVLTAILAYAALVFLLVAVQAVSAFGQ
jgi:hypothetical protein